MSGDLLKRARAALGDLKPWAKKCHAASFVLVERGVATRVARGTCRGVGGQHSWAVVGSDCYDPDATIIDPTLWSYVDSVDGVFIGKAGVHGHRPHGAGSIWTWGHPANATDAPIRLTPRTPLSKDARLFLDLLGPLDRRGWMSLASHAPVEGWPAGEVFAAMDDTEELRHLVPIDRLGMLTDRNPGGLYLRSKGARA